MRLLAIMTDDAWRPGIGDPTFFGWLIVLGYFAAAALCLRAWKYERRIMSSRWTAPREPRFWLLLAVVMFLLGINKQLDLQSLLTDVGRKLARSQGWYEERARVQKAFIAGLAGLGLAIMAAAAWWLRRCWHRYAVPIGGIAFLFCFILLRAASFHHVDALLFRLPWVGSGMNRLLELTGISLIGVTAARIARRS